MGHSAWIKSRKYTELSMNDRRWQHHIATRGWFTRTSRRIDKVNACKNTSDLTRKIFHHRATHWFTLFLHIFRITLLFELSLNKSWSKWRKDQCNIVTFTRSDNNYYMFVYLILFLTFHSLFELSSHYLHIRASIPPCFVLIFHTDWRGSIIYSASFISSSSNLAFSESSTLCSSFFSFTMPRMKQRARDYKRSSTYMS